jgi:hypothetical protein
MGWSTRNFYSAAKCELPEHAPGLTHRITNARARKHFVHCKSSVLGRSRRRESQLSSSETKRLEPDIKRNEDDPIPVIDALIPSVGTGTACRRQVGDPLLRFAARMITPPDAGRRLPLSAGEYTAAHATVDGLPAGMTCSPLLQLIQKPNFSSYLRRRRSKRCTST